MKIINLISSVLVIGCVSSSAFAIDYPKRKPGLWEIKTSSGKSGAPQTIQQCIDEAVDLKMQEIGKNMAGSTCSKNETAKKGDTFIVDSECMLASSKVISHAEFTGDFNSKYQVAINATYNPPMMGMKESSSTLEATYKGECAPGQKPGDMVLANGKTMNVLSMGDMAKRMKGDSR